MVMINFNFATPTDENPEGILSISVDYNATQYYSKEQFPLRLTHKNLMGEVEWSSDLYPGYFSQYLMNTYTNVDIIDSLGNKLFEWRWNPFIHGDFAHQYFEIWALNNLGSNGIAIGTHNGMTGEWVGPVIKGKLKATLVEASDSQFTELIKYYNGKTWIRCRKELITSDGSDVIFYEGGAGFTNSLSKNIIQNYVNESEITSTLKPSKSINDLIIESSEQGQIKWLHIDVEGMDGELIYAINDDLLPELLLFESLHMENEYYNNLCSYLTNKGYSTTKSGWNTICTK
jgi:hypothetical protein